MLTAGSRSQHSLAAVAMLALICSGAGLGGACVVDEHCFSNSDCSSSKVCGTNGECVFECTGDAQCGAGLECVRNRCVLAAAEPIVCPADMTTIQDAFCIDRWEASRPDATSENAGADGSHATSRAGVLPWKVGSNDEARSACKAAGKDLCSPAQWQIACKGPDRTAYPYGDSYDPLSCNQVGSFGPGQFHLAPTGSFEHCVNEWGVYDMSGNLWEHVLGGGDTTVRGGAFDCSDPVAFHRCEYVPQTWTPLSKGFRCCLGGTTADAGSGEDAPLDVFTDVQADLSDEVGQDASVDGTSEAETGCLDPDVSIPDSGGEESESPADAADEPAESEIGLDAPADSSGSCPPDMAFVGAFCMDLYEASHDDASGQQPGSSVVAASRAGVMPWYPVDLPTARSACQAAGKRLCKVDEWVANCHGPSDTVYSYGNDYDPAICNGIDTFCNCGSGTCAALSACPYPHCFNQASTDGPGPCGSSFHAMPTGSFPACHSSFGVVDTTGNVWELADSDDGLEHFRGGAYNCGDSEKLHKCDEDGTWGPSARGFRCCKDMP